MTGELDGPVRLERVPTVAELADEGLAHPAAWSTKGATHWRIDDEGQERIYALMRKNAAAAQAIARIAARTGERQVDVRRRLEAGESFTFSLDSTEEGWH